MKGLFNAGTMKYATPNKRRLLPEEADEAKRLGFEWQGFTMRFPNRIQSAYVRWVLTHPATGRRFYCNDIQEVRCVLGGYALALRVMAPAADGVGFTGDDVTEGME